jgi:hypothetical protein
MQQQNLISELNRNILVQRTGCGVRNTDPHFTAREIPSAQKAEGKEGAQNNR